MSTTNYYRKNQMGLPHDDILKKIDTEPVLGLEGGEDSLAYKVHEIEKHFHNSEQIWGLTSNDMARKSISPIVVTAGAAAWGTELLLTDGTVIESGSSTKKFDFNRIMVTTVGTANRVTILEFYYSPIGTSVACTFDFTGGAAEDIVKTTAHGLADGDKIVLKAGAGALPAELNDYTVYYVVNKSDDYFKVSLTSGGAAVEFTDDGGAAFWYPINTSTGTETNTQTLLSECLVSRAATSTDSIYIDMRTPRIPCNYRVMARGYAAVGTNAISFFVALHTYSG